MIKLQNLYKYYNTNDIVTQALKNVNLELHKNEIVAIIGESGSGKTTLLNVICGVDNYDEGEMYFKGNETSYFSMEDMENYRKKNVAFIYQNYNIIDSYTVLDNVIIPLMLDGISYNEAKIEAVKIIEQVGLSERINSKGANLSGGEKQRCVIARALASKCEILACDEPTGNLDSKTGDNIVELIKEVAKDKLVLIVTHNYEQIESIATRTIKISDGQVIEDYKKTDIVNIEETEEIDIDEHDCPKKNVLLFALKNNLNKINSFLFSLSVLTTLSILVMFLLLANITWNKNNEYNPVFGFNNTLYNRVVVYDRDHEKIDLNDFNDIEGNIYVNSFYEDKLLKFSIGNNTLQDYHKLDFETGGCFSPEMPKSMVHSNGNLPKYPNECYIIIPEDNQGELIDKFFSYLGDSINFKDKEINLNLKLCGYGYSKEVSNITFITYDDVEEELAKVATPKIDAYTYINDELVDVPHKYINHSDRPIVYFTGPDKTLLTSMYFKFNNIYVDDLTLEEYELIYYYSDEISISVSIPFTYQIADAFELSIYTDNPEKVIKQAQKMGYLAIQPGKAGIDKESDDNQYSIIFVIVSVLSIIVLLFISYIILSKLYVNKIKDYNIFRSLGYTKKDMRFMVNIELLIVTVISIIISVVFMYISSSWISFIKDILKYNSILVMIIFISIMLLLSLLISSKFNRKLFKFTVHKTFYREVL